MGVEINRGINLNNLPKPKDLNQKRIDDKQFIPKQFKDVAVGMEQNFAEMMLNQMNKAVDQNETEDSAGMDYYKGLQTSEQAKIMAQKNNLGLQDVILDQIYPKRLRNEMALKQYEAQVDRIHHNLPKLEASIKNDTIIMGKNESTPLNSGEAGTDHNKEGGLK
jgi:Rod binding domain-containing protein